MMTDQEIEGPGAQSPGGAAALLAALPGAVVVTDPEGRLTFWNAAAERLWGGAPDVERARWSGASRLLEADGRPLDPAESPMATSLAQGRPFSGEEMIVVRPDGTTVTVVVNATPLRDPQGRITGGLYLLVDISDRTSAEVDRALLAAIVSSSNDAIVSKTLDGIITSWNEGASRIFGYTAEETIGKPIYLLIPEELQEEEAEILARLRRGERIEHFETVRVAMGGRRLDISLAVSPLRDGLGRVVGASKVARDITERKRSEEMQRLLFDELNHRVKNTLATIQAIATQSLRRSPDPASFVASFSGRVQALARAHDLLVQGKMRGADVAELVREQVLFGPGEGRVRVAGPHVTLAPQAAVQLALVLHELATNARKHGALSVDGGRLVIEWSLVVDGGRRLALHWTESGVPGVTAPTGQGFGSTLIGRSLETAGGSARLQYGPDGLTCELDLPLPDLVEVPPEARAAEAAAAVAVTAGGKDLRGRRVLLVEDEPLVALDVESQLLAAGCVVVGPAASVARARELIAAETVDAALLDANLNGQSIESVAADLDGRGVPFAFATGYGREALPEAYRSAPLLAKPFDPDRVLAVLGDLVAQRGPPAGG